MKNLALIVAVGRNRELGVNNSLIWHLPNDLKFFKNQTMNKTIIMGQNTFKSLPGILPNRKHIVLTLDKESVTEGVTYLYSLDEVLNYISSTDEECFIIGGASVYEQFLPYCNKLIITEIDASYDQADVYFPEFDKNKYYVEKIASNEDKGIKYEHIIYTKKD